MLFGQLQLSNGHIYVPNRASDLRRAFIVEKKLSSGFLMGTVGDEQFGHGLERGLTPLKPDFCGGHRIFGDEYSC